MKTQLIDFLNQMESANLEVNSFILLQNGKATAQFWRKPYHRDTPQLLYSLSKSFTSIAMGIAWDDGLLQLDDPVISFFPDKLPIIVSANLAKMTIHHLLSMNTGHHDNIYSQVAAEEDWVQAFLSLEVEHEPGSHYVYNTHATYMLSAILERVTGQNLVDYLMPRLFEPLGISRPTWETCPMGITAGGMGLSLTTEGIAKFGQMLLQRGMFGGRRIVSEAYIELATTEQSDNRGRVDLIERPDSAQGYGYQFHLCRHGCYRGDGAFGQMCLVAPQQNIVIAVTASFPSMKSLQLLLDLIYNHILFRIDQNMNLASHDPMLLEQRLSSMSCPVPAFQPVPDNVPNIDDHTYIMDTNSEGLHRVFFKRNKDQLALHTIYTNEREHILMFDFTKSIHTQDTFIKDLSLHVQEVVTYAVWLNRHTLQLTLVYIETPYVVTYTIGFLQDQTIEFQMEMNVSLENKGYRIFGEGKI
ncbi:serine hydrolase domain-containing protein [Paenibacillus sp. KN14-4R]|uniref:serine hydrolase domain-containing protein n=1 Tax=Paenibacillus sp. KN14-4R TaxID=3445773 RepID=UPI003FA14312